ncbi:IS30 family transposase [Leuconostoc pseudomesenteroides]|uniref:IS30 family transposase n=1 Tax=Leuconostoc pseudomesenteroides TaxID=33968 RepID=UPI0032E04D9E
MGRKYLHLDYRERQKIETLREEGHTYAYIAQKLNRSLSTIYNEIHRNTMRPDVTNNTDEFSYNAEWAEIHAQRRRSSASRRKVKLTRHWQKVINNYLKENWSLEQIAKGSRVPYSTNTLYNYARDGYLRYKPKKYRLKKKKYHGVKTDRGVFLIHHISLRPKKVEDRTEFGHWEVDGVEGPRGSDSLLLTFLERKTRYLVAVKSRSKTNKSINEAMDFFFRFYGNQVKSCTFDRGNEFTNGGNVMNVTHAHGKKIYFTDAFAPWQRGSNEERNSRIREYYPKGTAFGHELQVRINAVTKQINGKPMAVLDWHSPQFKFNMATKRTKKKKSVTI